MDGPDRTPILTDRELSEPQRAWLPEDVAHAYRHWPAAARVELATTGMTFWQGSAPEDQAWDWRSVSLAARTYPTCRVTLWSPWLLEVRDLELAELDERYPMITIVDVHVLARYIVELVFDTGEHRVIDLEDDLWGPMFEPMRTDYDQFCAVAVDPDSGTIAWPNGAEMAPEGLYADSRPVRPG